MAVVAPQKSPQRGGKVPNSSNPATFERSDYKRHVPRWERIDDCVEGSDRIKDRREFYLPPPEYYPPNVGLTDKRRQRYEVYLKRAVFYNVTQWTLNGLVGDVFLRDPVVTVPSQLDAVTKDANGNGVALNQLAKSTLGEVLAKGRAGLLVDYPQTNGQATTVAQQRSGEIRPTITLYKPHQIINWKTKKRGGKQILSLVVLVEPYDIEGDDGFSTTLSLRYRVLRLNTSDTYEQLVYSDINDPGAATPIQIFDGAGNPLPEIPFTFVGSVDNGHKINPEPLLAIADLNLAHYRNSADYEEGVFQLGQPTAVATGLTKQWVTDVLKGEVRVGARGGIPLPTGATFNIAQVAPNTMAKEAMDGKEKQMQALGAKLVEVQRDVQQTATEAIINASASTSVLQSCANNTAAAFKWCLEWCAIFAGAITYRADALGSDETIKYEINTQIDLLRMSWQERAQLLKEWQADAITIEEYRTKLRAGGIAYLDDDEFIPQQEEQIMRGIEQQAALIKAEAQAGSTQQPGGTPSSGGGNG